MLSVFSGGQRGGFLVLLPDLESLSWAGHCIQLPIRSVSLGHVLPGLCLFWGYSSVCLPWLSVTGPHVALCTCPSFSATSVTALETSAVFLCADLPFRSPWQYNAQSGSPRLLTLHHQSCMLPEVEAILRWSQSHQLCLGSGYFAVPSCILSTSFFYHFWPELPLVFFFLVSGISQNKTLGFCGESK